MKYIINLLLSFLVIFSNIIYGWSLTGHQLISEIAYNELLPHQQQRLDLILDSLIEKLNNENKKIYKRQSKNLSKLAKLSILPDYWKDYKLSTIANDLNIKPLTLTKNIKPNKTYDWHYQNQIINGKQNYSSGDLEEVLGQLITNTKKVKSPSPKALGIIYVSHLVEDAHQPLHTISMATEDNIDNNKYRNDKGGNKFCLQKKNKEQCKYNLHQYWDNAGLLLNKHSSIKIISGEVNKHYPKELFKDSYKDLDITIWLKESRELWPVVYNTPKDQMPNKSYQNKCRTISNERMALAAYRLSELLKLILNT